MCECMRLKLLVCDIDLWPVTPHAGHVRDKPSRISRAAATDSRSARAASCCALTSNTTDLSSAQSPDPGPIRSEGGSCWCCGSAHRFCSERLIGSETDQTVDRLWRVKPGGRSRSRRRRNTSSFSWLQLMKSATQHTLKYIHENLLTLNPLQILLILLFIPAANSRNQ